MAERDDTAWLDEPSPDEDTSWLDEPAPLFAAEPLDEDARGEMVRLFGSTKLEGDPRYAKFSLEVRRLPLRKRLFLRFLANNQFHVGRAITALNKTLEKRMDPSTIYRWVRDDRRYKQLVDQYSDLVLEASGVSNPVTTLLRIDSIVEDALTPVPKTNNGVGIVIDGVRLMEVDRDAALKGLKMLGENQKIFRSDGDDNRRVTVILDFTGDAPMRDEVDVVDGEFEEVQK
jgi:hypothetical protein